MIGRRLEQKVARGKEPENHAEHARDDALGAVTVELPEAERASFQLARYDYGHEVAGDDKKYVDANKAARNRIDLVMEEKDRRDGEGPKAIDVVAELHPLSLEGVRIAACHEFRFKPKGPPDQLEESLHEFAFSFACRGPGKVRRRPRLDCCRANG